MQQCRAFPLVCSLCPPFQPSDLVPLPQVRRLHPVAWVSRQAEVVLHAALAPVNHTDAVSVAAVLVLCAVPSVSKRAPRIDAVTVGPQVDAELAHISQHFLTQIVLAARGQPHRVRMAYAHYLGALLAFDDVDHLGVKLDVRKAVQNWCVVKAERFVQLVVLALLVALDSREPPKLVVPLAFVLDHLGSAEPQVTCCVPKVCEPLVLGVSADHAALSLPHFVDTLLRDEVQKALHRAWHDHGTSHEGHLCKLGLDLARWFLDYGQPIRLEGGRLPCLALGHSLVSAAALVTTSPEVLPVLNELTRG